METNEKNIKTQEKKKVWVKPQIKSLSVKRTESGESPGTESFGFFEPGVSKV
jgi:hypothetical protein